MDPTTRFSGRAGAYVAARPGYPRDVLSLFDLGPSSVVADLGSGTGIFAKVLLDTGARVLAVEPNAAMREAAEAELGAHPRFQSIAGRAEATTLEDASVDLVTAAQAFHWFDLGRMRNETRRILKPAGRIALVWNDRETEGTAFLRAYEEILLAHCPAYKDLQGKSETPEKFDFLFGRGNWQRATFPNEQRLDREGLLLRVLSASYAPREGTERVALLRRDLEAAFEEHADDGKVHIAYTCVVIHGPIK